MAERLHSSAGNVMKHHADYAADMMSARSFVHMLRQFLGKPSKTFMDIERSKARLRKLRQAQPAKLTGRQVFLADAMDRNRQGTAKWRAATCTQQGVMRSHGQHWSELPERKKANYERQASLLRAEKTVGISTAIAARQEELDRLLQQQHEEQQLATPPGMLFSSCQFDRDAKLTFQRLHDQCLYGPAEVMRLRKQFADCPKPLTQQSYDDFCSQSLLCTSIAESGSPGLVTALCFRRDELKHSVLNWCLEWRGLCLKPATLVLLPLIHLDITGPLLPTGRISEWLMLQKDDFEWFWSFEAGNYCSGDALADVPPERLYLVQDSLFLRDSLVVSRSSLQLLSSAVDLSKRPSSERKESTVPSRPGSASAASDVMLRPGIATLLDLTHSGTQRRVGAAAASSTPMYAASGVAAAGEDGQDEEEHVRLEAAWHDLESQRHNLDVSQDTMDEQFNIRVDGGEWQMQRTGRAVYGMRCSTKRKSLVAAYCSHFGQKGSQAFELNVHGAYGNPLGSVWRWIVYSHAIHWDREGRPDLFPWASMIEPVMPEALREELQGIS
eukprot:802976-Amphidinium_carterae.1